MIKKIIKKIVYIWSQPSSGFGDTFAKFTKTFGIKPCKKCEERRKSWNNRLKYAKRKKNEKGEI